MPVVHHSNPPQSFSRPQNGREPLVSIADLVFAYHDGLPALRGVSLTIEQGEKVALVGPNGAGKSTLMLHLNGLLGDAEAPVRISGLPMTRENLPQIRARVGLVFQNPDDQLFSPTVFEDVAFGPLYMGYDEEEVHRRVIWALDQVGMTGFESRLSHHLSVGQKKRVAIATVLSMDPDILVLDEPTSALDPRGRRALIGLLRTLSQTILVSSHDMRLVRELFPRMIILDEGRIVADGSTKELMADTALLEAHGLEAP
jgi:cobalt/nickel transport system ATP-binding protein